jgi:hypothetical protein
MAMLCLYAVAPQQPSPGRQGGTGETGISMAQSDGGAWTSAPFALVYPGRIGDLLFVKFRIMYSSAGSMVSDTSRTYSFNVEGRPDLSFAPGGAVIAWRGDSISVAAAIRNTGNLSAPPFIVVALRKLGDTEDIVGEITIADSLAPGKIRDFSLAVDDSLAKGDVEITLRVNPAPGFREIASDNNAITAAGSVVCRDAQAVSDSLFSSGRGLCIAPANEFAAPRRIFLFAQRIAAVRPLRTESAWASLSGDGFRQFSIGCRPALGAGDSLAWMFNQAADTLTATAKKEATIGKLCALVFDTAVSAWRFEAGAWDPNRSGLTLRTAASGPFALARANDVKPPQIRAMVDGREIIFLDYAGKDKPFSILMNDPSGIIPSSIAIRLNGKQVGNQELSPVSNANGYGDVTVTAYPKKERTVDSLAVFARDFAGNEATAVFAYMPGEDLAIKFFSCHPNPFTAAQDRTGQTAQIIRFAYLLTDVARDVSITVYTIGGHPIWNWRSISGTIGYQEVEWNGKTSDGRRIANGTYFAKLTATAEGKKAIKRIKIAKLEGY